MNPDVFKPIEIPADLAPYFRRAMVAFSDVPVDLEFVVRGTGYCYLGWTPNGRWSGRVNGIPVIDTDMDGSLHLSGQVFDGEVICRSSGLLQQIFCEFTALGQFALLGIPGRETFERAINPVGLVPLLGAVQEALDTSLPLKSAECLSEAMFGALSTLPAAMTVPQYLKAMVGDIERTHGNIKVTDLLANVPVSERKARDEFGHLVGLSPKRFAKLLQINHAFGAMLELGSQRLAELAIECGFSDQAHMTRAFADFLGNSPVRFSEDIEPTLKQFVGYSRQLKSDR
ncbi:helix-turn-helix domain-containing protein [Yoonia sp. R2331]|uniref:AraC family transcriptional regulator n=1 Tax=Yoonia sp. R2331 TaxID=3237238 RepID=UPI0034E4A194